MDRLSIACIENKSYSDGGLNISDIISQLNDRFPNLKTEIINAKSKGRKSLTDFGKKLLLNNPDSSQSSQSINIPSDAHAIIIANSNLDELVELRKVSKEYKDLVDYEIKKRAKASINLLPNTPIEEIIRKLKGGEVFNKLFRGEEDYEIAQLFNSLSQGDIMYINKDNKYTFNDRLIPYIAQIRSGQSSDNFYNFILRNFDKVDLFKLTNNDVAKKYKDLFIKEGRGEVYWF